MSDRNLRKPSTRKFTFRKDPVEVFKCVGGPYSGSPITLKTNRGAIETLPFSAKGSSVGYYRCESTTKSHTVTLKNNSRSSYGPKTIQKLVRSIQWFRIVE